jgi:glycosyltransferase involved in cell wall biosynthesis
MNKVSVVITNYNQGHLISRSINSVLNQNYPKELMELIVIDDGSSDNSAQVIFDLFKEYQEVVPNEADRVNVSLTTKPNGGTASARNKGIELAKHDIVCFLDADDEYLPDKVLKSVETITKYPHVGMVYSDYIEAEVDGSKHIVHKPSFNKEMLLYKCIVSTNSCIHKAILKKVGWFDETIKGCEDYDLWLRIAFSQFMLLHIPEPLFIYYNHGDNKTFTFNRDKWFNEEKRAKERVLKGEIYVSRTK